MLLHLIRSETGINGTFGTLSLETKTFVTGELPWRGNRNFISCIPLGLYRCEWTYSDKFKRSTYELQNVPGRDSIRIHSANLVGDRESGLRSQVDGCIVLGFSFGDILGQKAIMASKDARLKFEQMMNQEPFLLDISAPNAKLFQ